jgi:hypothetical protein
MHACMRAAASTYASVKSCLIINRPLIARRGGGAMTIQTQPAPHWSRSQDRSKWSRVERLIELQALWRTRPSYARALLARRPPTHSLGGATHHITASRLPGEVQASSVGWPSSEHDRRQQNGTVCRHLKRSSLSFKLLLSVTTALG